MKKFTILIKESDDPEKYSDVVEQLKKMIEATIENSGGEFKSFIESFLKDPEEIKIEGLINDSDIYEFYLKYRNQIDEILNEVKFYNMTPEELGVLGLYDYVITGTQKSVEEFLKMI